MKKGRAALFCFAVTLLLLLPVLSLASHAVPVNPYTEKFVPNGTYDIVVLKAEKWEKAGEIGYDRFFKEKSIDLGRYSSGSEPLKIRIVQKGGGAAHIDSVFLGGKSPVEVKDIDNALKKLSKKDFDVIDAFGKTIEMTFPAGSKNSMLKLTARVEDTVISKTPFLFPYTNTFKTINKDSEFYSYKPGCSENTTLKPEQPFFKVLSPTGSGHPTGYTYGWVNNDSSSLYVTIDFTPDNTMDGNKDYAKVYIKTESGIKEFRISEYERQWGDVDFTYTDKVAYQHKLYKFRIPLDKLGIDGLKDNTLIQLAFAAYGTASPGNYAEDMAFDPVNNRHLVVFSTGGGSSDIYGRFVDCNGNPVGNPFNILNNGNINHEPSIAFDTVNNRYLVAWREFNGAVGHIYGALLDSNGTIINPPGIFAISDDTNNGANQFGPEIAFGRDSGSNPIFAVMWSDLGTGTNFDTFVRVVNPTNPPLPGTFLNLSSASSDQFHGDIAYNSVNNRFMVVWQEGGVINDIFGIHFNVIAGAANPLGTAFLISNGAANHNQDSPDLAYDPVRNQYLVVWQDDFSGDVNIYGRLVNAATEALIGSELNIAVAADNQRYPKAAYFASQNSFLAAWRTSDANGDVYGQYIDAISGLLSGGNFFIAGGSGTQAPSAFSYNSVSENLILAYLDDQSGSTNSSFALLGPGCSIPTMTEWGMIVFAVLSGLGAIHNIRRQKRAGNN